MASGSFVEISPKALTNSAADFSPKILLKFLTSQNFSKFSNNKRKFLEFFDLPSFPKFSQKETKEIEPPGKLSSLQAARSTSSCKDSSVT